MPRGEKVALGEISPPEDRVLRATNINWDATNADIIRFFRGYGVVDWKRSINLKRGKSTVAYILLSTLQDVLWAIEELDLRELLGRQVRIMRAREGFQLTTSGLLSLEDSDHSVIMNKNLDSPAIANVPAMTTESQATSFRLFTGTLQAQTTRGTFYNTLRPSRGPPPALINNKEHRSANMFQSHRRHFQPVLRGPEHRVLLISRLHYDANRNSVELFFQGFRIVDFKRKYNSTAFVLFESVEDRDRARYLKNGQKLLGREVILNIATRGVRVSNNGFLPGNAAEIALSPLAYGAQWPGSGFPSAPAMKLLDNPDSEADRSTHGPQKRAQAHTSTNDLEQADLTMYTARQVISETQVQGYNQAPQNYPDVGFGIPMSLHEMLNQAYIHTNIQRTRRLLGPWNIAGKNSEDKRYNMITENEWYGRQ